MKYSMFLILLVTCALIPTNKSHIVVKRKFTDQLIEEFYDLPALFGGSIPYTGIRVYPLEAYPEDGCKLSPTPEDQRQNDPDVHNKKWVLMIARSNCTFEEKIRNAQNSSYDAAIIYNIGSDDLEQMSAKNATGIKIPAVFVGETSGRSIIEYYLDDNEYVLIINDGLPFNINKNLILPFSILVGFCFIVMLVYMIYKCVRERRRLNQYRLPKRLLKKIPVVKFAEGMPYESCIICLEDYTKGERIRVLPCAHAYHCHCIDIWLTKNRRVCPICKRRVFVKSERAQTRRRQVSSDSTTDTDDDVQPLIHSNNNPNNHGTFPQGSNSSVNQSSTTTERDVEQPHTTEDEDNVLNSGRRENPFNRNADVQFEGVETARPSWWRRLFRRSNSANDPLLGVGNENENENRNTTPPSASSTVAIQQTASNNIMNSNLSGSFQDDNGVTRAVEPSTSFQAIDNKTDVQSPKKNIKRTPTNNQQQKSSPTTSSSATRQPSDADVFIEPPSQGGIGVAALPNTNLNRERNASNPRW